MIGPATLIAAGVGAAAGLLWAPFACALVERWPESDRESTPVLPPWPPEIRGHRQHRAVIVGCVCAGGCVGGLSGLSLEGLAALLLGLVLVPVIAIDIEHLLIPDVVVLPAAVVATLLGALAEPGQWWVPIAWGVAAGGSILIMWLISPSGIGLGDAKLALLLGATLGASVVPALAVAFVLGGLAGVLLLLAHGPSARALVLPFGPFLAAGAAVALVWDPDPARWT